MMHFHSTQHRRHVAVEILRQLHGEILVPLALGLIQVSSGINAGEKHILKVPDTGKECRASVTEIVVQLKLSCLTGILLIRSSLKGKCMLNQN